MYVVEVNMTVVWALKAWCVDVTDLIVVLHLAGIGTGSTYAAAAETEDVFKVCKDHAASNLCSSCEWSALLKCTVILYMHSFFQFCVNGTEQPL